MERRDGDQSLGDAAEHPPIARSTTGNLLDNGRSQLQAGSDEVPDPYYGAVAGFDLALDRIEPACDGLLAEIRRQLAQRA